MDLWTAVDRVSNALFPIHLGIQAVDVTEGADAEVIVLLQRRAEELYDILWDIEGGESDAELDAAWNEPETQAALWTCASLVVTLTAAAEAPRPRTVSERRGTSYWDAARMHAYQIGHELDDWCKRHPQETLRRGRELAHV